MTTLSTTASASIGATLFRSPLRYPGGKQKAISEISKQFPSHAHEYREPLVGGGSVYCFARNNNFANKYWINDKFAELVSFWQVVQNPKDCRRLMRDLERLRQSFSGAEEIKEFFLKARQEHPEDPYRTALLFFFFNRVTFSGTTRAGGFSSAASISRFTASSIQRLGSLPEALKGTEITCLDFEKLICAPGKNVFIFLDPPYFTATKLYGRNGILHSFDHERLASALKKTRHRFLMTYDDCPEIRELYAWAQIEEWQLQYGMNNCNSDNLSKLGSEIFVRNYRI